jgi:hypothetical protein
MLGTFLGTFLLTGKSSRFARSLALIFLACGSVLRYALRINSLAWGLRPNKLYALPGMGRG